MLQKVDKPDYADIFGDTAGGQRFVGFCHLYFRIATAMGGFQELGRLYFDIMRDSMFQEDGKKVIYAKKYLLIGGNTYVALDFILEIMK